MSNDPKKPLDPTPAETPDLLTKDLNLDRRNRRVPTFEELQAPGRPDVATTQPGIPGPFARPQPAPGTIAPGTGRQPIHFELAATAQTPRHGAPVPRPQVTAQPATGVPTEGPTRAPVNAVPPGLAPRAPPPPPGAPRAPAPSMSALPPAGAMRTPAPPPTAAAPAPAMRAPGAPPMGAAPRAAPGPQAPSTGPSPAPFRAPGVVPQSAAQAAARTVPAQQPVPPQPPRVPVPQPRPAASDAGAPALGATPDAPTMAGSPSPAAMRLPPAQSPRGPAVAPPANPASDATRNLAPPAHGQAARPPANAPSRAAPPSPTAWAARTPSGDAPELPTMPVPAAPKLTAASHMQGATVQSGAQAPVSVAPVHQPAMPAPSRSVSDEIHTAPNRPAVPRPAPPPAPSFQELPHSMPSHLVVTQPGFPNPFKKADAPVMATPSSADVLPVQGPTRVLDAHDATPDEGVLAVPAPAVETDDADVMAAPAALWRRVFAWLVDLSFIGVVVSCFFAAALAVIGKPSVSLLVAVAFPALGVVGFVAFVYTTLFAFLWRGRTPGRRLLGIHLVDASGHAPRAGRALVRAALSLASFGLFLSGFWLALFDRKGQTLHDKLTSTFVVRLKPAV
ncbi:MAG: RDD family protein [Myxococcaceae bacterium]|nr:RDD family protein [Myxococcaceae bacterium]